MFIKLFHLNEECPIAKEALIRCYSYLKYEDNLIRLPAGKPECWDAKRMWNF
jgi:hypothetical protein